MARVRPVGLAQNRTPRCPDSHSSWRGSDCLISRKHDLRNLVSKWLKGRQVTWRTLWVSRSSLGFIVAFWKLPTANASLQDVSNIPSLESAEGRRSRLAARPAHHPSLAVGSIENRIEVFPGISKRWSQEARATTSNLGDSINPSPVTVPVAQEGPPWAGHPGSWTWSQTRAEKEMARFGETSATSALALAGE